MELEQLRSQILEQGFKNNHKIINGFIPNYIKGENTCLFIINKGFWNSKIVTIHHHFITLPETKWDVYGVLSNDYPQWSPMDWAVGSGMNLIRLNPLEKAEYSSEIQDFIYKPFLFN